MVRVICECLSIMAFLLCPTTGTMPSDFTKEALCHKFNVLTGDREGRVVSRINVTLAAHPRPCQHGLYLLQTSLHVHHPLPAKYNDIYLIDITEPIHQCDLNVWVLPSDYCHYLIFFYSLGSAHINIQNI